MFLIKFYFPNPNKNYILKMTDLNMLSKNNDKLYSNILIPRHCSLFKSENVETKEP